MTPAERLEAIHSRLHQALTPQHLEIIDESHHHVGHKGAESGAGHFKVVIAAEKFGGKTKIAVHQMIYALLQDMMDSEIHALSIQVL